VVGCTLNELCGGLQIAYARHGTGMALFKFFLAKHNQGVLQRLQSMISGVYTESVAFGAVGHGESVGEHASAGPLGWESPHMLLSYVCVCPNEPEQLLASVSNPCP
jgi:hypothetical protein